MIKGTYVFKQNNIEVGRSNNLITTNGKKIILQYFANPANDWAAAIAVGGLPTTPSVSDQSLYYEFSRAAVTLKSYKSGTPNLIIAKATLDASIAANIYEVGIYPNLTSQVFGTRDQFIIEDFSNTSNLSTVSGTAYTANPYAASSPYSPRFGLNSISIPAGTTVINTDYNLNLSLYTLLDTIDILANATSTGTLTLTATDINGVTFTLNYSVFGSGYQVLSQNIPNQIYSMSTIKSLQLSSTSNVTVDCIRISVNAELSNDTSIVSRSVLSNPIAKLQNIPLDIEYYLELS